MGDSSDNIPGVAGIGEKTASALVKEFGTLEQLYASYADSSLTKGVKSKLEKGEDSAKESKWLATIVSDAPINTDLDYYKIGTPDSEGVSRLLTELEMFKLLDKLDISASAALSSSKISAEEYPPIEIDIHELTSETISQLKNVCFILYDDKLEIYENSRVYTTSSQELIKEFLASDCEKTTIDAKPVYRRAMALGISLNALKNDAAICGYLLNPASSEYSVEKMCAEYDVRYRVENERFADLVSLEFLVKKLRNEIEKAGMTPLFENIEMPLTEVLAAMEHAGVGISADGVREFGNYLTEVIEETQQMIFDDAGHEFNISSPKQLGTVLFEEMGLPAKKKTKMRKSSRNCEITPLSSITF